MFANEAKLNTKIPINDSLETIKIEENLTCIENLELTKKSNLISMSGQEVHYISARDFNSADRGFSWGAEIVNVLTLAWNAKEKKIYYRKGKQYAPERLRFWVLHTFLPLVLELERTYRILHVGSVEVEGKPILFSAFSFGGKSTLTDYFLKQGHTLLSDDSLGIEKREDGYYAIPSYPFHRPFRQLETLGYYTENFSTTSKPVHAVYRLEKAAPDADVSISELKGIEKFKAFHYSAFVDFDFMKQERFVFFTQMAKAVPVYQVQIPWDKARLPEVYEQIVKHSRFEVE